MLTRREADDPHHRPRDFERALLGMRQAGPAKIFAVDGVVGKVAPEKIKTWPCPLDGEGHMMVDKTDAPPLALSRSEAAHRRGLSVRSLDRVIHRGEIKARNYRNRVLVPISGIERF